MVILSFQGSFYEIPFRGPSISARTYNDGVVVGRLLWCESRWSPTLRPQLAVVNEDMIMMHNILYLKLQIFSLH